MEDEIHLELRENAFEQVRVQDRARVLLLHPRAQRGVEQQVERDDRAATLAGQAVDQPVADLTRSLPVIRTTGLRTMPSGLLRPHARLPHPTPREPARPLARV